MSAAHSAASALPDVVGVCGVRGNCWVRCVTRASVLLTSALVACRERPDAFREGTARALDDTPAALELDLMLASGDIESSLCGLALDPEPGLVNATRVAAARWSAATGCGIRIAPGGVRIAFVEQPRLADGTPKRAVTIWSSLGHPLRIEYRRSGFAEHAAEVLLAHELAHALGMREHTGTGIGADPVTLQANIDAATLDAVCSAWRCASFNPEP